jgi:cell wall-associated NlpC family hydrolase
VTNERHLIPRWPAIAVAVLTLVGVVLMALPADDVEAAPAALEDTAHAQVTAPVRPASFGRKLGGANPGRTGPIVLGLTIADLGDPATVAVPTAVQPPTARVPAVPRITTTAKPGTAAAAAIAFALVQRGLPYVWGGDGPLSGEAGFDCSGLTTAAYDWAGVSLPRTAHTQYYAGPHVPADAPLEPGDLVFYGVPERVHHVGLYVGNGRMINAPTTGDVIREMDVFSGYWGPRFAGGGRVGA